MRISELYKSVAQLGFEETLESDTRFFFAANRALLQVASLRPAKRALTIHHEPLSNRVRRNTFSPLQKKTELVFEASGVKSYYFECNGTGRMFVERYDESAREWVATGWRDLSSDTRAFVPYRDFIKRDGAFFDGLVRLRFTGDYLYSVKNVAMYADIYSESVQDIPAYEPYTRYDVSALVSDFLALDLPVVREDGAYLRLGSGYEVENGRVLLFPFDTSGAYLVHYHHKPAPITTNGDAVTAEEEIDLDEDLCALLPFLVAALVWVDDEPQKSEYYLSIYRERASLLVSQQKNDTPVTYRTNGW